MAIKPNNMLLNGLDYGTHETPWDLSVLCFVGAPAIRKDKVISLIEEGAFPDPTKERCALVQSIFDAMEESIALGLSRSTIQAWIEVIWRHFKWADKEGVQLSTKTAIQAFCQYAETLKHNAYQKQTLSHTYVHGQIKHLSNLLGRTLKIPGERPGGYLLELAKIPKRPPPQARMDTPKLTHGIDQLLEFGNLLSRICDHLDSSVVRGSTPIRIPINQNVILTVKGDLKKIDLDPKSITSATDRKRKEQARAPLPPDVDPIDVLKRSSILNLRIEAELLMFIAQTGMNLTQAANLKREHYRWQRTGGDLLVFRVYKGRRSGDAIFRCFKSYRKHLDRYLKWLNEVGVTAERDERLFPIVSRTMLPARGSSPNFSTLKTAARSIGIKYLSSQKLRHQRINWLFRFIKDSPITANMAAHSSVVLHKDYIRPDPDVVHEEIRLYNHMLEGEARAAASGKCSLPLAGPKQSNQAPKNAPKADCTNPDGCLFCDNYRDILSYDYCWRLASHCKLKELEAGMDNPSRTPNNSPAAHVIERISKKLNAISKINQESESWVAKARSQIRSSIFHPQWRTHIEVIQELT